MFSCSVLTPEAHLLHNMSSTPSAKFEDSGIGIGPHEEPVESSNQNRTSPTTPTTVNTKDATPSSAPVEECCPTPQSSIPDVQNGSADPPAPEAPNLPDNASGGRSRSSSNVKVPELEAELETVERRFEYISYDTGNTIFVGFCHFQRNGCISTARGKHAQ